MAKRFNLAEFLPTEDLPTGGAMEITPIPIQLIDANWKNFYSVDWQEEDLAESILVNGLLTPLGVLRKDGGRYKLISGHRRLKALKRLHDTEPDGKDRWSEIPCVIYDDPMDVDREELMLIHANSTARVLSPREIAEQAKKIKEILVRMSEGGAKLPGRMRDVVAAELKISSTRLARLEAIDHNLTYPGWRRKWEKQAINESVAYRVSQLTYDEQMHTADWIIDHHIKDADITAKTVEEALAHPPLANPGCGDPLVYETDPTKVDRELVRRAGFLGYFSGARFANRKDGMDQLKVTFRHAGHGSDELDWQGEAKGVRFTEPVDWLLGWGAMYDALAANALDGAIEEQTTRKAPERVSKLDRAETPAAAASAGGWHRCLVDEPEEGQTVIVKIPGLSICEYTAQIYRDGVYTEPEDPEDEMFVDTTMWWTPVPALPEEE